MVPRVTTACGFGTVGIDGTVGIERWGGGRGDGVSLWAAARDFLFLGRSRCCSGGAQNNGSGQRNYRPDRHFPSPSPFGCDRYTACSNWPPIMLPAVLRIVPLPDSISASAFAAPSAPMIQNMVKPRTASTEATRRGVRGGHAEQGPQRRPPPPRPPAPRLQPGSDRETTR